jgi:hypothetical protein
MVRSGDPRMRLPAGQARTIASRHVSAAVAPAARTTKVRTHAATKVKGRAGGAAWAARRSIADTVGPSAKGSSTGRSAAAFAIVGAGGDSGISRTGTHWSPQREQRTTLRGVRRAAGTSYSAAQAGQAIRMKTHDEKGQPYWNGRARLQNGLSTALSGGWYRAADWRASQGANEGASEGAAGRTKRRGTCHDTRRCKR